MDLYKRDQLYYHSIRELNAWVESNAKSNLTNTYGVRFHPISKSSEQTLTKKDVIALNLGIHTKMGLAKDGYPGQHQLYRKIAAYGQKLTKTPNAPKFVYIVTPAQHFASFDGVYTEQSNKFCIYSINSDPRATMEREIFEVGSNCDAVLDAVNMTSLGNLHVGVSATMTDCSHYCQPGVPDISAGRLVRIVGELIGTNHNSTVN